MKVFRFFAGAQNDRLLAERPADRIGPAGLQGGGIGVGGGEDALCLPLGLDFVQGRPEADGEACEVAGAHRGGFSDLRTDDRGAQDIGLELHHEVVAGGAAVDLQFGELDAGVLLHRAHDVHGLEGDAFEGGAGDMGSRGTAGNAADGTMGILIPVGGAHAGEGRDEIDAAVVLDRRCQGLDLGGTPDDAQAVAEPLDDGTAHEDGSFQGIIDLVPDLPGDGSEEVVAREDGLLARVHQEEAAGAVGVLHGAGFGAHLAEEGGLLVAGNAADGHFMGEDGGLGDPVYLGTRADLRHHGRRDIQEFQQFLVPFQRIDVEQHRPGGVGDVGHMDLAACKLPHEPAVHGAEAELAGFGLFPRTGDVVQDPADLGAGKIWVDEQPRALPDQRLQPLGGQGGAEVRRAAALPDDGVAHGPARAPLPDEGGLPLVGDADARNVSRRKAGLGIGLPQGLKLGLQDAHGVVLHPAGPGVDLGQGMLRQGGDAAEAVEYDGSGAGGPLVQSDDVRIHADPPCLFSEIC